MPPCLANFFVFLVEMGFHHVGQDSLKLLTSGDPPTSASQSAGITGMSHRTQRDPNIFNLTIAPGLSDPEISLENLKSEVKHLQNSFSP